MHGHFQLYLFYQSHLSSSTFPLGRQDPPPPPPSRLSSSDPGLNTSKSIVCSTCFSILKTLPSTQLRANNFLASSRNVMLVAFWRGVASIPQGRGCLMRLLLSNSQLSAFILNHSIRGGPRARSIFIAKSSSSFH